MLVQLHPHARERMQERGASEAEVVTTVLQGERFEAKHGRQGFRRNFPYNCIWMGRHYSNKQIQAYAVEEPSGAWLAITVIVRYF